MDNMKNRFFFGVLFLAALLCGSAREPAPAQVAATTLPVYEMTQRLCEGTGVTVTRLVTEDVSCLHDYSLSVRQVKAVESAQVVVISGGGLESFLDGILEGSDTIDASRGIALICPEEEHDHDHDHGHESDPHIWLSPVHAQTMAQNICDGLCRRYPDHAQTMEANLRGLLSDLEDLRQYGQEQLAELSCRELVTFHDGFAYFAQAFDLTILEAIEEESGREASARELIHMIGLVRDHSLPAVFTEKSGSVSAAGIIARETGCAVFDLDMAMAGDSYFDAMYHNIDTIKEALQ